MRGRLFLSAPEPAYHRGRALPCSHCVTYAPTFMVPTGPQKPGVMPPQDTFERLCALCLRTLGRHL